MPEGSFDASNVTTVGNDFFGSFNQDGHLTDIPLSFKRPAFTGSQASQINNFQNAFNSSSYTINRNAADIINGGATPDTDRNTFSDNQPGLCFVDDNRKVTPGTCTPNYVDPTSIQLTAELTLANQLVTVNKYFANAHTIDWGDGTATANLTANTTHTYTTSGTYTITLALTGIANRWTFTNSSKPWVDIMIYSAPIG